MRCDTYGVVDTGLGNGPVLNVGDELVAPPTAEQAAEPNTGHRDIESAVDEFSVAPDGALYAGNLVSLNPCGNKRYTYPI